MKISIEGYKSIGKKRTVEFKGLTILAGANSSGKSSFMQPLLLIKQTLDSDFDAGSLLLDGPNVKLTDSSEIISKVPQIEREDFAISFDETSGDETKAYYKFKKNKGIQIDGVYHKSKEFPEGIRIHNGLGSEEIEAMLPENEFPFHEMFGKDRKLTWQVLRNRCFLDLKMVVDGESVPFMAGLAPTRSLAMFARRMIHVPGLRGNPERSYKAAISETIYPGSFERYVASIIHNWKESRREKSKFNALGEQLKHLGLASSIDTRSINDTRLELRISRHSGCLKGKADNVNIADVGFGVSQTLPVLVALLAARKNQLVYIEQPELHLHPRAQFNLGSIIADAVSKRGINVVIETHSSLLIRAVQIEVAKKKLRPSVVSLNWFTQNGETGQTEIDKAEIDKYGAFGEWPADFDDVTLNVEQAYLDVVELAMQNEI
ncbi:AAA family ATPase [Pseudoduganella sp. FT93W]|uniref:AAA family ATPase n=1 Tax=Duganella fentianensis TaxID=2692177 RepID=A0A845I688_9BURK|nr:AAA family ATPase [Duganella fentianensis]MYN47436.1 AAA family ATPase [Duganella fentianensis]